MFVVQQWERARNLVMIQDFLGSGVNLHSDGNKIAMSFPVGYTDIVSGSG